jgi:hypothetical protein
MKLWHPLQQIPPPSVRWPVLALLLALSLWLGTKAGADGYLYNDKIAPYGIVSLELAGDATEASRIISFWDLWGARDDALRSIAYDYIFLLFYSTTLALACVIAASLPGRDRSSWYARLGLGLAWAQWLAALLDVIENVALTKMLTAPRVGDSWPVVAWWCAIPKFALIILGLLYIVAAGVVWFVFWGRGRLGLTVFAYPKARSAQGAESEGDE